METVAMGQGQATTVASAPTQSALTPTAKKEIGALWLAALGTAALGAWTIFDAMPGINWGLWTCALCAGLIAFTRHRRKAVPLAMLVPLALAAAISLGSAITADEPWLVFIVLVTVVLVAVGALFGAGDRADTAGTLFIVTAPIIAGIAGVIEVFKRLGEAFGIVRSERSLPALRGVVIALPVVGLFALLLSGADPVLAGWREAIGTFLDSLEWLPRLVFFSVLGTIALGGFGYVLRGATPIRAAVPKVFDLRLGVTERLIMLGSVAGLFALFLGLQLSYFFGNAPSVAGSGITFAEYARRGFAELTVVVTLCTVLILVTDRFAARGPKEERVRITQLVLVGELQLFLVSAFRRVLLYEDAYGFTTARLYAQAYMVVVSICLAMLAWEIWKSIDARRLARRGAVVAGTMFAGLLYWNHHAWIASRNIDRYAQTGKIDVMYLGRLSPNAVPTVVSAIPRLNPADAALLRTCLHQTYWGSRMWTDEGQWYEWNLRRNAAKRALSDAGIDVTIKPAPTPPGGSAPVCRYVPI
ncbi:MAG TPA: DUF4173 domain-containing protein [Gemmatimonadaceae bacterium]|nr:DUF4173 domain-containing protein [Gemmatimonadaceae bacterium]